MNFSAKTGKYSKLVHPKKKAQKFNFHAKNPDLSKNHLKNVQTFNFDKTLIQEIFEFLRQNWKIF